MTDFEQNRPDFQNALRLQETNENVSDDTFTPDGTNPYATDFRAQAIQNGLLVDVSEMAEEAGFLCPVAVTANLWADIQAIPEKHDHEDVKGRLWDVLYMARVALQWNQGTGVELSYELVLHVHNTSSYTGKIVCGIGDAEEPVITLINPAKDINVSLGHLVMTPGAQEAFQEASLSPAPFIGRHQRGDWGELDASDIAANNFAASGNMRILSAYTLPVTQERIWIITEWDRSMTTILLPSEY